MSYGDPQRYWLACVYGTSPDTCRHSPRCVHLENEHYRGDTPPFGNYWRSRQMGTSLDPAEPPMTVAAALAAYDNRPGTGPGTGLSSVIQPNKLAALERVLAAVRAGQAALRDLAGDPPAPPAGVSPTAPPGVHVPVRARRPPGAPGA